MRKLEDGERLAPPSKRSLFHYHVPNSTEKFPPELDCKAFSGPLVSCRSQKGTTERLFSFACKALSLQLPEKGCLIIVLCFPFSGPLTGNMGTSIGIKELELNSDRPENFK